MNISIEQGTGSNVDRSTHYTDSVFQSVRVNDEMVAYLEMSR
jgi:hypothetical protein